MGSVGIGKGVCLKDGKKAVVLTLGPIGNAAAEAIATIEKVHNITIAHYDMRFLKPIDETILQNVGKQFNHIFTVEDGTTTGGLGSAVLEFMSDNELQPLVTRIGIPDEFIEHGTPAELYRMLGLDAEGIANTIVTKLGLKNKEK